MTDEAGKISPVIAVEHDEETQPPKTVKSADDAHVFIQEHETIEWTDEEERKLLWKIDIRVILLVWQCSGQNGATCPL